MMKLAKDLRNWGAGWKQADIWLCRWQDIPLKPDFCLPWNSGANRRWAHCAKFWQLRCPLLDLELYAPEG